MSTTWLLAAFVEFGGDDTFGVGLGVGAGEPHLFRRPQPGEPVAPRGDLEAQLLVVLEARLEFLLAILESGHDRPIRCPLPHYSRHDRAMCTLVILRRPDHAWPVVIGANRDEMIGRPAQPPARHWPDRPEVVAGLDQLAGGSWLGVNDWGVAAAILNRHGSLGPAPGQRSRGELVLEALDHADAVAAAEALTHLDPAAYRTFNLIVADNRDAFWLRHADAGEYRRVADRRGPVVDRRRRPRRPEQSPRLALATPRFRDAAAPDPDRDDWRAWEVLLDE